VTRSLKGKGW